MHSALSPRCSVLFEHGSWESLSGESRRPTTAPQAWDPHARAAVLRVRRSLQHRPVGLVGARAIQHELRTQDLLQPVPSLATLKQWSKHAGLVKAVPLPPPTVRYPALQAANALVLHAMDWTARYLEGGAKVFVFYTVDAQTQALLKP